jgi:hypothetical protein
MSFWCEAVRAVLTVLSMRTLLILRRFREEVS